MGSCYSDLTKKEAKKVYPIKHRNPIKKPIYRKKPIPKTVKKFVWDKWIGPEIGQAKCLCCNHQDIRQIDFHCGHVVSEKDGGLTKFYVEAGKYGLWYEFFMIFIMLVISDTWFYWSHRAMHHPSIYKYVHALHHKSLDVNPYTSSSFHVIESLWLTFWLLPLAILMPISMTVLGIMQVIGTLNNLKSHLGYELFPKFFILPPN